MAKKKQETKLKRPIVVAVMGHVDHGKTSLLDAIRGTDVQSGEAGGITQNTRTHQIDFKGNKLTFIDTPGHEAFSAMRSRGAKVTDIVVLVVAADDGVQPQTKESIKFAKESGVPIIVALNKIDLPGIKLDRIKQELSQFDVLIEEYGGDTMVVPVSAKKKKGIDDLLETIILQAEILEIKKNKVAQGSAEAFIMESLLDKTKGPISIVLVKAGEIEIGDFMISPLGHNKIRSIMNEFGKEIEKASEGDPVYVIGSDKTLPTGEMLLFSKTQDEAIAMSKKFEIVREEEAKADEEPVDDISVLAALFSTKKETDDKKLLNVVLKTDVQGTLEAVSEKLNNLGDEKVGIKILTSGTGPITEQDVLTAKNSKGFVIGFQSELSKNVEVVAKRERVLVRNYEIIYQLLEEIGTVIQSMIDPEEEIVEVAVAEVKQVFTLTNGNKVAGCKVTKGKLIRGYKCFVLRGEEEIGDGKITSLKHNKEEMKEIKKDQECGVIVEPEIDFQEGDKIVCYKIEKI